MIEIIDISNIKNIAIVGAGIMGYAIAQVALLASFKRVILNDIDIKNLNKT